MINTSAVSGTRPRLAFRIGITGARTLDPVSDSLLRLRVRQVLGIVRDRVTEMAKDAACQAVYDQAASEPVFHLLSPLAEGADRLAAEEALAFGFQLTVPLPFRVEEYEADFPATKAEFRVLLDQARPRVLELDGGRGEDEARSYEAAGRMVVRNCDLVIAIFNGGPGRGRGGTAEIARYASRFGPPVWWLRADGAGEPVWVTDPRSLRYPGLAPAGAAAEAALAQYLTRSVMPPQQERHRSHGILSRIVRVLEGRRSPAASPLLTFLAETPRPARWLWSVHKSLIAGTARWSAGPAANADAVGHEKAESYWGQLYQRADRSAVDYGNRYRSSYVIVFGLAAFALMCAVLGIWAHAWPFAACELIALLMIAVVVAVNEDRHWQDRLINYRLLAELCRKQLALATLGWSLPMGEATRAVEAPAEAGEHKGQAGSWVGWYFNAVRRAAPLCYGAFDTRRVTAARQELLANLVSGQAEYHVERNRTHRGAAQFLGRGGELLFLATVVMVVVEAPILAFAHEWHAPAVLLGLMAACVPALSAALVGIRSYAELEMIAEQSARMGGIIRRAKKRLSTQPLDGPLASQEMGAETFDLADEMLRDLTGWTQLFSVKAIEAG